MFKSTLCCAAFTVILASTSMAETVVKRYDGPLPDRSDRVVDVDKLPPAISTLSSSDKVELPTTFYILPSFKIDALDAAGETTAIAVRNEAIAVNVVEIRLFEADSAVNPIILSNALLPKEVWTLNLRAETGGLTPDIDGFIRGWGRIVGEDLITADYFQIEAAQDFANGSRPVDVVNGGFCENVVLRFLLGGGFSGGTTINFMLDQPLGGDPETDPPSITGTSYRETGAIDNTFEIFTDNYTLEVDASDLVTSNFGSIDIKFENAFGGGFATAFYKANDRYSVSVKSVCLDAPVL